MASGMPKLRIEEAAAKKQARIDSEAGVCTLVVIPICITISLL